jgi:DNA-directed RNA polymerase specialized sigma54-like protein
MKSQQILGVNRFMRSGITLAARIRAGLNQHVIQQSISNPFLRRQVMADVKDKVKSAVDDAASKAKEATNKLAQKASEAAKYAGQKVRDAGKKIKDMGK